MPPLPLRTSVALVFLLSANACSTERPPARADTSAARVRDTTPAVMVSSPSAPALVDQPSDTSRARRPVTRVPLFTADEQRVADGIVFAPKTAERFLVAARNKRLLLDIGRVDLEVKQSPELLALVRRVSSRTGPLARSTHVRVYGTWGEETDSIIGYDTWNGRAVAVLGVSPRTDSLLRRNAPLVGVAMRAAADRATASLPAVPSVTCTRDSIPPALRARVAVVRDSLVRWVTDSLKSPFPRLVKATAVRGDATTGCFGAWRAVVIVTSRTPSLEWNEERALLVAANGTVAVARLRDLRLRAHESLMAFDADGDGADELAARGLATNMGAQSVLKLDPASRRFSRFASGFAWESR
ncbi:MAG: hypothetical protein ABI601_02080 [bacterium]